MTVAKNWFIRESVPITWHKRPGKYTRTRSLNEGEVGKLPARRSMQERRDIEIKVRITYSAAVEKNQIQFTEFCWLFVQCTYKKHWRLHFPPKWFQFSVGTLSAFLSKPSSQQKKKSSAQVPYAVCVCCSCNKRPKVRYIQEVLYGAVLYHTSTPVV